MAATEASVSDPDPDKAARQDLRRHKALATLALGMMAGLIWVGREFVPPGRWAHVLEAAARAGLVGGLADWFAVTALFRRPLGLPIPHTAIIPRQKARLGAALGRFVANHVFTEADVAGLLDRLDAPTLLHNVLRDPAVAAPLAASLGRALPRALRGLEDGRAKRLIERMLPKLLGGATGGVVLARALRGLVAGGRHQDVFGFILRQLRDAMAAQEEPLRRVIEERVREQGGRLIGWAVGASVARRVLVAVNAELEKMEPDGSDLRAAFDEWVKREIERIETDPARAAELGRAIGQVFTHATVRVWFWDVWHRLAETLARDAEVPAGRTQATLMALLDEAGNTLVDDGAVRLRLNAAATALVMRALPDLRLRLAEFISRVVAGWDEATVTDKLELRVGRDLQYVRINGTLVGFLVGGALQAALGGL